MASIHNGCIEKKLYFTLLFIMMLLSASCKIIFKNILGTISLSFASSAKQGMAFTIMNDLPL